MKIKIFLAVNYLGKYTHYVEKEIGTDDFVNFSKNKDARINIKRLVLKMSDELIENSQPLHPDDLEAEAVGRKLLQMKAIQEVK